jgi:hypothetical protein
MAGKLTGGQLSLFSTPRRTKADAMFSYKAAALTVVVALCIGMFALSGTLANADSKITPKITPANAGSTITREGCLSLGGSWHETRTSSYCIIEITERLASGQTPLPTDWQKCLNANYTIFQMNPDVKSYSCGFVETITPEKCKELGGVLTGHGGCLIINTKRLSGPPKSIPVDWQKCLGKSGQFIYQDRRSLNCGRSPGHA